MPFNEHPSYPAFEITVCKADTVDEDMDTMYIYIQYANSPYELYAEFGIN